MIFRKIQEKLDIWKKYPDRKVLLLRGARQIGKTYSIRNLAKSFEYFLEVNFEEEKSIHSFFQESLNPHKINEKLSAYFKLPIIPEKTLLFFDEIQACPQALSALRFYYEKIPQLHVIAAGSLLEFALEEISSYGVGRISSLFMYPLTFGEFLCATGEERLYDMMKNSSTTLPVDPVFHHLLLEKFRIYQILGGRPEVIEAYCEGKGILACQEILDELLMTIEDDFAKYKKKSPVLKLHEVFHSIAFQAGKKFMYTNISETSSAQSYKEALELLIKAGLAYKIPHTSARGIPLGAQINPKKFKVIPSDLGFAQRLLGLKLSEQMIHTPSELINKGSLAEMFVGLELIANSSPSLRPELYYWHRESKASNAEVDYVLQKEGEIIPIEVKAGTKGQMQSLFTFLDERNLPYGIRLSHENFGAYDRIKTVPIYATENILKP